ncbi:hypothetical protein LEP1GSC074_1095 [Leptospira noguchii str. Hook]|uniref:Uncharacterized protein n=1 Tax=Leptospira noguchii serovar Autumnalis str. ZUN142 TaxID=1085540 RepID=M6U336_9LEPT|nr:hypothetical protein LEP1GSC186_1094 [Leptospira noguchii serovar Autumnalis str. ZUN142]EMS84921.1 hypothetical protein LEP1GSC074_1095 [Leptospira noguchii str. Hook]
MEKSVNPLLWTLFSGIIYFGRFVFSMIVGTTANQGFADEL